jgi:hypothetical protein
MEGKQIKRGKTEVIEISNNPLHLQHFQLNYYHLVVVAPPPISTTKEREGEPASEYSLSSKKI